MATTSQSFALTNRYQRTLKALSERLALIVALAWDQTEGIDDDAAARFSRRVGPVDTALQQQAVTLADAYIASYLSLELARGVRPLGLDLAQLVTRRGVEGLWSRPVVTARAAISRGRDYADARAEGRARAMATGRTNVALAARASSAQAMTENGVTRYRRVTAGRCCALCAAASTKTYRSEALMPLHPGCSCVTEAIVDTGRADRPRPAPTVEDSPEVAAMATKGESVVKVVEHDELGPLLWQAGQAFAELT